MAKRVAFNVTESPCVIDLDGRTIPGLGWAEVETTAPEVKQAVEVGFLTWPEVPDTKGGKG